MDWHYANDATQYGPIGEDEFLDLVTKGVIRADTLIWCPGMTDWQPYGRVIEGTAGWESCGHCGASRVEDEMIRYGNHFVCQDCKPVFIQYLKEGLRMPWIRQFAGFWVRFGAKCVDGLLFLALYIGMMVVLGIIAGMSAGMNNMGLVVGYQIFVWIVVLVVPALYNTYFVGKYGATLGKMAFGVKVVTDEGEKITYLRALARHFAEWLSYITMYIGYIIAGFDKEKRTLHDLICSTRVVMK